MLVIFINKYIPTAFCKIPYTSPVGIQTVPLMSYVHGKWSHTDSEYSVRGKFFSHPFHIFFILIFFQATTFLVLDNEMHPFISTILDVSTLVTGSAPLQWEWISSFNTFETHQNGKGRWFAVPFVLWPTYLATDVHIHQGLKFYQFFSNIKISLEFSKNNAQHTIRLSIAPVSASRTSASCEFNSSFD